MTDIQTSINDVSQKIAETLASDAFMKIMQKEMSHTLKVKFQELEQQMKNYVDEEMSSLYENMKKYIDDRLSA